MSHNRLCFDGCWFALARKEQGGNATCKRPAHTWVTEGPDWSSKCVDLVNAGILIFLPTSRIHTSYSIFVKFCLRMTWIIFLINFGEKNLPLLGNLNLKNNTAPEDWLRLWNSQITSKLAGTEFFASFFFLLSILWCGHGGEHLKTDFTLIGDTFVKEH